jgi:hypothetical protein
LRKRFTGGNVHGTGRLAEQQIDRACVPAVSTSP